MICGCFKETANHVYLVCNRFMEREAVTRENPTVIVIIRSELSIACCKSR